MERKEFYDTLRGCMEERLDAATEVKLTYTEKNNGVVRTGLSIQEPDSNATPIFYLEAIYDDYKRNGCTMDEIVERILTLYRESAPPLPSGSHPDILDFENIRDRLFIRIVNYEANRNRLKSLVYEKYLDLAIIPHIAVRIDESGMASAAVTKELAERWNLNLTSKKLLSMAKENTRRLFSVSFESLTDAVTSMVPDIGEKLSSLEGPQVYILSNLEKLSGSMWLAYDSVLEDVRQKLNVEKYYILPSSIHELLIVWDENADAEGLAELVSNVNRRYVLPEERLSDNAYCYDGKKVFIAGKEETE